MKAYQEMTREELLKEKEVLEAEYGKYQKRGLQLDMSRGKPSQEEQLDLSMGMMDVLSPYSDLHVRTVQIAAITVFWTAFMRRRSCLVI